MKVMFDTCAVVALLNEASPTHASALGCYKRIVEEKGQLLISAIVVSEYAVCNSPQALFELFEIVDYNARHALEAARLRKVSMDPAKLKRDEQNRRSVIINDTQIIAQANGEQVDFILTNDAKTFKKTADQLFEAGLISTKVLLLSEFPLEALGLGMQMELPLETDGK